VANQSVNQTDDGDNEIGANDDVDSDDQSNISKVDDYLTLLGKDEHKPTNQLVNQQVNRPSTSQSSSLSEDIDQLSLNEEKFNNESKHHPSEAWTTSQSNNQTVNQPVNRTLYQSKRAIIELIDDDEDEPSLVDELD
jgi:hypothetical protein